MAKDYIKAEMNTDDIFIRNVMAGTQGFFDKKIYYKQTEKGKTEKINVPFYTSYTGDEQFLMDYYYDPDPACGFKKIEGTTNVIPSGVFTLQSPSLPSQELMNKYERATYNAKFENEFGEEIRDMSARTFFIPVLFEFNGTIKTSSDNMRFKIWQSLIRTLYKVKKFYIQFEGFSRIPCLITFPENYNMPKEFQFEYEADNKRPTIEFSFEVLTYLPDPDFETEVFRGNKIDKGTTLKFSLGDTGLTESKETE